MTRKAQSQPNIWSAALIAAGCRARAAEGRSYRVRWQCAPDHVRFAAPDDVVIEPLGVRLSAGDVLVVRWLANATAYSFDIRRPGA